MLQYGAKIGIMKIYQIPEAEKKVQFVILGHILVHDDDMGLSSVYSLIDLCGRGKLTTNVCGVSVGYPCFCFVFAHSGQGKFV